jgi:uncharacterized protein YfaS (alpha-2-macroglobulin family)
MPVIETDRNGAAHVDFGLADTITTWRLKAVGSSADGRIVDTSTDIRAFQPFFLEFQPPASLTEGDEISLPLNLRNYTESSLSVETTMDARSGIEIVGARKITHSLSARQNGKSSTRVRAAEPSRSAPSPLLQLATL